MEYKMRFGGIKMKCEKLFATIDGLYKSYLDIWEDVCNVESPTQDKARVDAVGKYFSNIAEKKGWEVEIFESFVSGNVVCITMNPDVDAAPVTYSAHMDTVYPVGSFGIPAVRRDGDKIYGPGVTDCKGGLVAALLAMDALDRCDFRGRPIRFLLQSNEEGGPISAKKPNIDYICNKAIDSVAFINLEGNNAGEACVERKGTLTYRIMVTGVEAHSSLCAIAGASAIAEAAHMILELEKFKDDKGLTCNCGVIQGGTTHNTVPGYCEFRANIRFANAKQRAEVQAFVENLARCPRNPLCSIALEIVGMRPAMERVERNLTLLETMNDIFEKNGLSRLSPSTGTGGSDAAQVTEAGIPCVDCIGVTGGDIHSPSEYAELKSLKESAKRLAALACCI